MHHSQTYVLIIGQPSQDLPSAELMAQMLRCPVVTMTSPIQALALAQSDPPHLIILPGDNGLIQSHRIARQLRKRIQPEPVVIVAITAASEPSWQRDEDNPEIDGFFVEPLSADVLSTLNESAITKKRCLQMV